jgi:tetratricopeptide (TPR) repeat protein
LLARRHARAALEIALSVQSPEFEAVALCALGNAELALGQLVAAISDFERALALAQGLDNASQHDARSGLARALLVQGDVPGAQREVGELLAHLNRAHALEGSRAPLLIRLTCYQVLARVGDPRAPALLQATYAELQALAATISDPVLRHSFLYNIPEHGAIIAAAAISQLA